MNTFFRFLHVPDDPQRQAQLDREERAYLASLDAHEQALLATVRDVAVRSWDTSTQVAGCIAILEPLQGQLSSLNGIAANLDGQNRPAFGQKLTRLKAYLQDKLAFYEAVYQNKLRFESVMHPRPIVPLPGPPRDPFTTANDGWDSINNKSCLHCRQKLWDDYWADKCPFCGMFPRPR
jgi:hypothetical protein